MFLKNKCILKLNDRVKYVDEGTKQRFRILGIGDASQAIEKGL
jgi:hypothetical protein